MMIKIFTTMIKKSQTRAHFAAPRRRKNRRSRFYFYLPAAFFSILLALSLSYCADTKGILTDNEIPPPPAMYLWRTTDLYKGGSFGGVAGKGRVRFLSPKMSAYKKWDYLFLSAFFMHMSLPRRRMIAFVCICEIRLSVTSKTSPISFKVRSS